ncbi:LamG domain-containing protein, partial [Dolichospermum sp. ST_sed4]|nr:LamG domain-containing protein [Dolichospermum sp. ST_sed4]
AWGKIKVKQKEWTHIAGTYDGKVLSLYINGELDVTANLSGKIATPANPLGLGKYSGEPYTGGLDEIFLFNRALSQNEIKEFMKGYKSALTVVSTESKLATAWGNIKVGK